MLSCDMTTKERIHYFLGKYQSFWFVAFLIFITAYILILSLMDGHIHIDEIKSYGLILVGYSLALDAIFVRRCFYKKKLRRKATAERKKITKKVKKMLNDPTYQRTKSKTHNILERKETYEVAEILPLIGTPFVDLNGDEVKMNSGRLHTFRNSIYCTCCGLKATYFAKERHGGDLRYHLNLYGIDSDGDEVLFTKDHIVPKSKGGRNSRQNYQTMCSPCNALKGNNHTKKGDQSGADSHSSSTKGQEQRVTSS